MWAINGDVEVMVRDHGKQELGRKIIADFETSPARTAFIGDSDADAGLAEIVGLLVAYNSQSKALKRVCKYVLEYGELEKLTGIFQSMQN